MRFIAQIDDDLSRIAGDVCEVVGQSAEHLFHVFFSMQKCVREPYARRAHRHSWECGWVDVEAVFDHSTCDLCRVSNVTDPHEPDGCLRLIDDRQSEGGCVSPNVVDLGVQFF